MTKRGEECSGGPRPYLPGTLPAAVEHVERYEATGGAGVEVWDTPIVVLWTIGRRTGGIRKSPVMRVEDGGRYAAVASLGGAPQHPVWYLNLLADPRVRLQDGPLIGDFVARPLKGDERVEWWRRACGVWPAYDEYQARTDRVIPVVLLERWAPASPA